MRGVLHFLRDQSGATATEYAIIALLVALLVVGPISLIGPALAPYFTRVATHI